MDAELRALRRKFDESPNDRSLRAAFIRALGRASPDDPLRELLLLGVDAAPSSIDELLPSRKAIVLVGERGTSKESVARWFHERRRRSQRFRVLDVRGVSLSMIETELFGVTTSVFTGGLVQRAGIFESMSAGTVFVAQVDDVPELHRGPMSQGLLRILDDRAVLRIGETRPRPIDVDVVFGARRPIELRPRQGLHELRLLPLRERVADVPELIERLGGPAPSSERLALLSKRRWRENDLELRALVERAKLEGWDFLAEDSSKE